MIFAKVIIQVNKVIINDNLILIDNIKPLVLLVYIYTAYIKKFTLSINKIMLYMMFKIFFIFIN